MGLISSPTNRNMLHLWKFFTVILVLQACLIYSNDAKQTKEDLTFDDTFDIDRYEEDAAASAATNAKSRTSRDLDVADLLEDELQPADEDENIENDESGWFFKGVRRVRRELGRIFGGSNEKIKPAKQHKKRNLHNEKKLLKTKKEHLTNKLNKHSKRAENGDPYDPLEGSGRGEHLVEHMKYYETHFLIHEPWMEEYRHGRVNEQFVKLEAELSRHLRELFLSMAPDDADIDSETRITLDGVEPSSDSFKIYVTCTLYLTEQSETAYRNLLYTNLLNYHRIGDMGAEIDDKFYLRQYRGRNTETEAEAETTEAAFVDACLADPDGWFTCRNGQYIECEKRCNNLFDCEDESDEEEALCRVLWRDDETSEATISQPETEPVPEPEPEPEPDNEIPEGITEPAPEPVQDYCAERPELGFVCGSGERISCSSRCDGLRHCADGSDESPALCSGENEQDRREEDEEHREENREEHRENNYHAEEEGSGDADFATTTEASQPAYLPSCRSAEYYTCPYSNYMICAENRCDNHEDCPDGEDEADCGGNEEYGGGDIEKVCAEYEFKCDDRCLPKEYRCNGNYECIDRTDEDDCPTQKECQPHEFKCRSGDCIDSRLRCDRVQHCPDGDDEDESCPATRKRPSDCAADEFFCDDDCHPNYIRCNGYADCTDGSDEHNCYNERPTRRPPPTYPCPQHTCPNGKCYSENERCDRVNDCDDGADEQNCSYNEQTNTPAGQLNLKTYPDSQIIKERREVIFRCRDEGPLRARVRWTRPGGRPLPIGSVDKNGRLEIPNIRVEDSGQYICEAVGYPRHVPGQQVTVHLTVERFNPLLDRPPTACHQSQATCMNGECIDKSQICDGTPHCSDGSDEHSCSHGRKCHPNQFMCRNSKCVDRIWRCDGENDCGDNSDEESCEPEPSGAPCRYDEFQCKTGHCIPKSFQCDDTNDCIDASDEIGCAAPTPIRPLPPSMNLRRGESLNLTCVGTGIPVPVIVWRLNWGHVPEKCVSKSYSGTGTLYCADMQQADSGAYSCEIINSKGSHFVTPDTLVTVDTPIYGDVCPAGFFNMLARSREDCISCFCFGVSKNCKSANLFNFALQPPINSNRVLNVELNPYGAPTITEAPSPNIINLHHGVQFRASDVQYNSREMPYLALPEDYLGNQLKSYGGFLRYEVNYVGNGRPVQTPDVIITGNGMVLVHRSPQGPQPSIRNKMSVQLTPGNWNKPDGRSATREEIMMVLANVEHVLLRLSYIDSTEREVEIINLVMDSAGLQDQGLGAASLIEQCQCPVGYIGDSCETCAPGYVRQPGGPWLGRCVPFVPEPCAPGTYGDPRRGIPCRECPCPQSGSNNFASGCKLGPDGEVTCDCYEGYSGRRCEHCAPGFDGNPLVPGGSCHRVHESVCNSEGTYYPHPNGTCECKPLVVGPRCDMCAPESFNLNSYTYTGCTECFCSGLTKQCSSSSWYRDQISSSFGRSRAPHGFTLIRDYERPQPSGLNFDETGDSLQFSPSSNSEPLYWNLPAQFLGDKITAYGGKLNYTLSYNPLPGGLMSRNNAPDVVIKSGEEYTIIHQRKAGVNPSQSSSYSVPIIESAWQRSDGQVVNREHLLMALSKIDAIYIKATYTTSTKSAALMHVSLDIATQNNIGTPRAVEVEECRCPVGYIGLSCERCSPGYKRDTEAGLYLGICEPCECNGHSSQCDAETGVCMNCADNTEGENCERCIAGYVGNPSAGTPYDCQPDNGGYPDYPTPSPSPDNQERCRSCSQAGTTSCEEGVCHCKPNVVGIRCDQCRPGTYGLHSDNHDGCSECYCSGKSTQCHSASLYRQLIPIDFIKDPPQLTDEDGIIADTENLNHDLSTNQYIYSYTSYTQKYWSLRGSVLGNQLHSYGGDLTYNLQVESYGEHVPGPDVILIGNGLKLTWSRPRSEDQRAPDYHIRLHEENNWYRIENGRASSATRLDLMQVLSNLDHILLRATPLIPTTRTSLRDVILESAVEHPMPGAQQALEVELCSCPPEYTGNSCESCAPLHYRDSYGNCAVCPCQEDSTSSCALGEAGYVVCNCKPGHKGDRCQIFDDESPYVPTTTPIPEYRTQITVSITPPKITIIPVGGSITLTCTGHLAWNNDPVLVSWYKKNDEMPIDFTEDDGILHMYNLQIYDSGVYICKAVSNQTGKSFEDEVSITITEGGQRTPAKIENLPNYHTFTENVANQIVCDVSGNPAPTVTWTRVDGQMSHDVTTDNNRLIFHAPRQSDRGHYRCQATNSLGTDEKYTQINVELGEREPQPQPNDLVYIEPSSYNGVRSDNVRLTCHQTGTLSLVYQWTKDGYPIYPQSNVQISNNVIDIRDARGPDSGTYICTGVDPRGRRNFTSSAVVRILESGRPQPPPEPTSHPGTVPPTVKRLPEEHRIIQGHDFSLTCEASGTPYPNIKWTKVHESLADNVHPQGNVLRIINARPENRGMYLCIAENSAGSDQSHTVIDVEPRERPTVDIHPPEPQTVYAGQEARLYCNGNGIPEPRLQWRRVDGKPLPIQLKEESPGYITIDNIKLEDAGDYECAAENDIGKATAVSTIRVIEAPSITLIPNEEILRVTEGDELKIICSATGSPSPSVKWENDESETRVMSVSAPIPSYNQAFLEIYRVDRSHSKTYKCIASNEAGTDERYVTVDVQPRRGDAPDDSDVDRQPYPTYPSQPQQQQEIVYIEPPQFTGRPGDSVRLICNQRSSVPMTFQWTKDGYPIYREVNIRVEGNVVDIEYAKAEDSGTYTCSGFDPYSRRNYTSSSVVTFVDDNYPQPQPQPQPNQQPHRPNNPPQNIYRANAGDAVTLTCDLLSTETPAERIPYLTTRWERVDGRPLPHNSRFDRNSLIITGVEEENSGKYRCNAMDSRGTVVTFIIAELVLMPIPHITFHPKMPIVVIANENVDIYCEVTGEQPIDVSWHTDNNRPLPPSVHIDGQYLRFVSITPADAGRYYCSASNRYGNTTNMAEVVVNRGNSYEQPHTRRHDINEGEDVTLTCDVQDAREPIRGEIRYEWHREDGRPLPYSAYINNQILFLRAVRKEDEGRYVCESYTTAGYRSSPSYVDLNIKPGIRPPPYIPPPTYAPIPSTTTPQARDPSLKLDQIHSQLRVGESTNVECYSSDNTYTNIVWERADGSPLPLNMQQIGNRLYINHVSASDAGIYVCKCKTDEGDLYTTSYELEIEASEHEWKPPRVVHAKVGGNVNLDCNADERSNNQRWSRQYGQMQTGHDLSNAQLSLTDVQANDAGTYICSVNQAEGETIDYPTILVVDGAIPHFHQDPISYLAFPPLADSYHKFNFDITFRPEKPNGLLLYNGQQRGSGDYISLSLNDRYPEFRFNFDGKHMIVKSEQPIELNEWHTVRVIRFRRDGYMQVDEQHPVAFPTLAAVSPLDLVEDLYIGNVPNWDLLPENAIDQHLGFVGCVSRLTLQGKSIELMKEAKFKEGIGACDPCKQNPCKNGGVCLESQTESAYTCICAQGWTGHNCGVRGSQCTPGVCGAGRCENTLEGMECSCPLNKTGDRCQYIEHLKDSSLAFKVNSYAAYGTPRASKLNIKLQIRPNSLEDSLLLYAAESSLPSGDYFALALHDKHIELISNTGARLKPVVARSLEPIEANKWTEIEIARRFGDSILRVNNEPEQRAKAGGLARMLNIKTPLYVGGYDKENVKLNRDINITRGFDGCISKLYEARRQINLLADIQDAANVLNCGELNEIDHELEPSDNYERPTQPTPEPEPHDACAIEPCENGGTCSLDSSGAAICDCTVGFTGKHCEEHITLEFGAKFNGNGYLELNRSQFDENVEQKYSFAALVFSTINPDGLLLWWGQPNGVEFTGQDFMALGLVDGIIEFSFRLNGAETVIRNPDKRVDDGKRHVVLIKRTDNTAMLELDHILDAGETTPTGINSMSLPGHVFIGGAPDVAKFTGNRYIKNFTGCVHVVEGETSGTIPLGKQAISGVNVDTCPQDLDPLGGTEPPVV